MNFYISNLTFDDKSIKIHFNREIHLINDFSIKMLIEINIIVSKKMIFDDVKRIVIVDNCDLIIKFNVTIINHVDKIVQIFKQFIIFFHTHMIVSMKIRDQILSFDRDYFFHSKKNSRFETKKNFFVHITNANIIVVQIRNVINQSIIIFRNSKLNKFQNYDEKKCYLTLSKNRHLIVKSFD